MGKGQNREDGRGDGRKAVQAVRRKAGRTDRRKDGQADGHKTGPGELRNAGKRGDTSRRSRSKHAERPRALIIGAGVSGLTTAHALLDAGFTVTLAYKQRAEATVSSVAVAIWHPYLVDDRRATRWAGVSLRRFIALARVRGSGVRMVEGRVLHPHPTEPPTWAPLASRFGRIVPRALPPGMASGYRFDMPLIETPVYLPWLREQVRRRGATFRRQSVTLSRLAAPRAGLGTPGKGNPPHDWDVVVNCSGLAARTLVGDATLYPIRGQLVRLPPGVTDAVTLVEDDRDPQRPVYVMPRADGTVVGGTAIIGDWSLRVRPSTTRSILDRAAAVVPAVAGRRVTGVRVGLRPGRPTVRLELDRLPDGTPLVHNYGHGGSGVTLSWGCADAAARLARKAVAGAAPAVADAAPTAADAASAAD